MIHFSAKKRRKPGFYNLKPSQNECFILFSDLATKQQRKLPTHFATFGEFKESRKIAKIIKFLA